MADHAHSQSHASHGKGEHAHGMGRYVAVWLALLVLTILTVVTGRIDLGAANIWVAMGIATTKATLVVLFFMHLWESGHMNRLVLVTSILMVATLVLAVMGDLMTREPITMPLGSTPTRGIERLQPKQDFHAPATAPAAHKPAH